MNDSDYTLDVDEYQGRANYNGEFGWKGNGPPDGIFNSRKFNDRFMNSQYSEAYGNYRGGYGRDGGYGPPRMRPYTPRGGPPPAPLGFGPIRLPPRRNPGMHKAAQFLAQCEVAPQYIKILPRELLDMIEPEYCGLCAQKLDSFILAKIHYNCKNHYKNQKKFMAQMNCPNTNQPYDIPLKARNLYCELCDVHITSKSHAESHYAGRSHRSIVEGRKPPKNPILLQRGMEARVDQLIRREKKNAPKQLDAAAVKEVMATPVEKNIPPELICKICNTTVTCTEQMTFHLNGKRHLAKEKQYILNTMRGQANQSDAAPEDEIAEENGGAAGQEDACGDETAAAAEEWGNDGEGGEDWDANN